MDDELIGRLLSGLYTFVDGHIYYNNNVIKIRFDILSQSRNIQDFNEFEIFDYYRDVIKLENKE